MGMVIAIMGESGSGKTTSMRNIDPKTTFYIDADKKGLSWRNWRESFNKEASNYRRTDVPKTALDCLIYVNTKSPQIRTVVVDTINGLMVADEMRRSKEKGYDKWQDLAQSIYDLVDYALVCRDDLNIVFLCHTQTDRDDNGYLFTRIKTSGKKLDKITLESKFNIVLLSKCVDGRYVFETSSKFSTAKTPMGMFENKEIENDINIVLEAISEY